MAYAGPYIGYHFLVLIDAKSNWVEVAVYGAPPSSLSTINMLMYIFAIYGYPEVIVSDHANISPVMNSSVFVKLMAYFKNLLLRDSQPLMV